MAIFPLSLGLRSSVNTVYFKTQRRKGHGESYLSLWMFPPRQVHAHLRKDGEKQSCVQKGREGETLMNKANIYHRWINSETVHDGRRGWKQVYIWPRALRGPHWSQWASWPYIYHLATLLVSPKVYLGSKENHQIHKFSVTYFSTFSSLCKNTNFVPFPFQILRNLITFHEISKIIVRPSLLPFSAFVHCSDFPTLDTLKHIASQHCLSSLTIIALSIHFAITLCHQAWLIRQVFLPFSVISYLLFFPIKKPVHLFPLSPYFFSFLHTFKMLFFSPVTFFPLLIVSILCTCLYQLCPYLSCSLPCHSKLS